jgi:hypothetical protein
MATTPYAGPDSPLVAGQHSGGGHVALPVGFLVLEVEDAAHVVQAAAGHRLAAGGDGTRHHPLAHLAAKRTSHSSISSWGSPFLGSKVLDALLHCLPIQASKGLQRWPPKRLGATNAN